MKQRKLFAILTLVAFMMTLLPMAAFAATAVSTPTVTIDDYFATTTPAQYTIKFTPATAIAIGDVVDFDFGFAPTGATVALNANNEAGTVVAGNVLTVTTANAYAAGSEITAVISGVTNPVAGSYSIKVNTTEDTVKAASNTFYITNPANRFASTMTIDKDTVVADGSDFVKVVVNIADNAGRPVNGEKVYIATDREIEAFEEYDVSPVNPTQVLTTVNGKAEFQVKASVAGTAKLAVGIGSGVDEDDVRDFLQNKTDKDASTAGLVGEVKTITFQSASAQTIDLASASAVVADGITEMKVVATVTTSGGAPVKDEKVTFTASKTGIYFDKDSYTTDAFGKVTAKVTSTKAGDYDITARVGSKSATKTYTFTASGNAYNIELEKEATTPVAKGVTSSKLIKVKVTDINGNKIKSGTPVIATVEDKPTGGTGTLALNATNVDSNGYWQYDFTGSRDGEYKLRFKLTNGRFVDTFVKVQEQGDVVDLTVEYDESSLAIPTASGATNSASAVTVKRIDAAGVAVSVTLPDGNIQFSSSNPSVAIVNTLGVITTATNEVDDSQKVIITVTDTLNNLVATTEMPLYGAPVAFTATAPATVDVNEDAEVVVQFIDKKGNPVSLNTLPAATAYTVLSKPANAGVDVSYAGTVDTDLRDTGKAVVKVSSTVAGPVKVQLRIQVGTDWYTTPVDVNVAMPKAEQPGANKVTLFIGQQVAVVDGDASVLDVAPFIKDGRTFVPVRFVGEALGADVKWDEATQTVTATRGDDVIVLTIGSNVMTVNGEATVTDVAPFITEGNRTVLPFRAVAEAFGAEVAWDAATQSVVFEK